MEKCAYQNYADFELVNKYTQDIKTLASSTDYLYLDPLSGRNTKNMKQNINLTFFLLKERERNN